MTISRRAMGFCLMMVGLAGAAQATTADDVMTFLVTGTVVQNPYGNPGWGTPGQTLQFEYTINPLINPEQSPDQIGPITAMAYRVNGGPFVPDNGWGNVDLTPGGGYGFSLYPGSGELISYNASTGIMLEYDNSGFGAYAQATSFQQLVPAEAPEIDPRGLVSGMTLLIGGLLVLRGRRPWSGARLI